MMEKQKVGSMICLTCGNPLAPVKRRFNEGDLVAECARCLSVNELIEELLRKKAGQAQFAGSQSW